MVIPVQVSEQYQQSISYIQKNSTGLYPLVDNISFIIHNTLDVGCYSFVYNVSVIINNTTSDNTVLKYEHLKYQQTAFKREYNLLTKIQKYITYPINIPLLPVHPSIP
eukprot:320396_1